MDNSSRFNCDEVIEVLQWTHDRAKEVRRVAKENVDLFSFRGGEETKIKSQRMTNKMDRYMDILQFLIKEEKRKLRGKIK